MSVMQQDISPVLQIFSFILLVLDPAFGKLQAFTFIFCNLLVLLLFLSFMLNSSAVAVEGFELVRWF